ncbi:lariat debranching enzyme A-like isoform X2 [Homarus americanus]|uniref:Lariat debranching enzyme-like n=2 Tax=Homarus americanus TaxID=6706 RepID=A0A8J5MMW4_HOMAM|nr:lariat debranching enzyme A-like isoform X2 [Homarus americanus]XP_042242938.1 lariat debranching enzyme A-like isoform X2 [Homarus americanus]KAG7157311.1 Lariat debranching enzyme-like [Homarus americanus]
MYIAVEGCSHGELDTIYNSVVRLEQIHGFKVDLLLCCGDFQSVRNEQDLKCMACPVKYMEMHDFYKYHSGEKKAPMLTIFIGGNHEASNYLQEFPYGGWVAPNIYYLGYAGVVRFGGLRIGGLSGIYKGPDFLKGHYEKPPYSGDSIRSVYHVRNLEVFRLKQLSGESDIFMSHDWPRGIYHHGPKEKLMKWKQHFRSEIENNTLGSRAAEDLLKKIRPKYWFSGHLHVKFPAVLRHKDENTQKVKVTKFLALDKCLPRRDFLQVIEVPSTQPLEISYDAEWLTILRLTNHLLSVGTQTVYMPGPGGSERYQFTPTKEEIEETIQMMNGNLRIPNNFSPTAESYNQNKGKPKMELVCMPLPVLNPQTTTLCDKLDLDDPLSLLSGAKRKSQTSPKANSQSLGLNDSELNITLETSKISNSPDEVELSDEDNADIVMEMRMSPDVSAEAEGSVEFVLSPIRRDESVGSQSPGEAPLSSSPRYSGVLGTSRQGMVLSSPKAENQTSPNPFICDSSSTSSSLSESESSPHRSPQAKRTNDEEVETLPQVETVSSSSSIDAGKGKKKFKRRNQAVYSSTEEDI